MSPIDDFDVRVDLSGLDRADGLVSKEVEAELRKIGLDLLGNAIEDAPVEEGTLRGSGSAHFAGARYATAAELGQVAAGATPADGPVGSSDTTVSVAFNTVYAAAQHERTDYAHPKGGKAKYLEDALERNREMYVRKLAEAGRRAL